MEIRLNQLYSLLAYTVVFMFPFCSISLGSRLLKKIFKKDSVKEELKELFLEFLSLNVIFFWCGVSGIINTQKFNFTVMFIEFNIFLFNCLIIIGVLSISILKRLKMKNKDFK